MSPKDRDLRSTSSPPADSPAAKAISRAGRSPSRDELERQAAVARAIVSEKTNPYATDYETLRRAEAHAKAASSETGIIRMDLAATNARIDDIIGDVAHVREKVAGLDGKFDVLTGMVKENLDTYRTLIVANVNADIAERRDEGATKREEKKADGATRRWVIAKLVGALVAACSATGIITALVQRGC